MSEAISNIRMAFVAGQDPRDKRSWSGIPFYCSTALMKVLPNIDFIDPPAPGMPVHVGRLRRAFNKKVLGRSYDWLHSGAVARAYASHYEARVPAGSYDVVFACAASSEVAYMKSGPPLIYMSDATFAALLDYYPGFHGLPAGNVAEAHAIERACIQRAAHCVFASEWAARSAIRDYGADPAKVHVLPMGANLDSPPTPAELSAYAPSGRLRLLLLGVSWERKGGAIALEALKALRARGVDASLTICGCTPPEGVEDPQMEVIPFLNKNDPEQARRLRSLLINSDCLLLPTQAECFGIVFSEASAFGLPSIAPDTGGVATAVVDGVNGVVLPADASGGDYARALEALFHDGERLMALRRSSRRLYETSHNWDAWAQAVAPLVVRAAGGALR